ncbi:hypothetical protein SS1G_08960 [Sclerotinia sclerotiorum 1980 UF-70]|uniref:Altered inheritance of mitochondria protein 9, mitochondrial n=1 Tax=Sclerotinia sclerotiorum (strain ATCC 18683 / 1980 / Ss-1) TaxID=665079 RepID=A7EUF3_SCLS1|nr:hypothetical protein SS1G_08960 [Sclerotinia sclerotiorum 1980 UF-70]EDN93095.1 hypothetical protein SS1G_08960 [Sclerotinia sclerotiorum 1980 UF-70]
MAALFPFIYTSGRWLHRDKAQRALRRIDFQFQELCKKILSLCPDASHIMSYEKKEGGFNKVLIFLLNDGKKIVARLPTQVAGPSALTTNSESDDSRNPIGSEYIIMKHVEGVRLQERWSTMSGSQYTKCVQSVCMTMQQLAALEFPAYGSIYFENAPFESTLKVPLSKGFCIGTCCSTRYWNDSASETETGLTSSAGPWQDLAAYSSGLVANGYSKLPSSDIDTSRPSYFGTVKEHRKLLNAAQAILQSLIAQPQVQSALTPTLLHADLHARNIYVLNEDPTLIICLIDWQSSSIEPAFIYANDMPDFAVLPDPRTEEKSLDEATSDNEPPLSEQDIKMRKVASYCNQAYEICMKAFIRKLRVARSVDQSLVRPFQYSNTSWRDSATAVRQEFLDLAENWNDLGLIGECPYIPTKEELEIHRKAYKAFQHVQELKLVLIKLLRTDSDGWVPIDRWDEVRCAHKEVFNTALESAREEGSESTEVKVRELWPFDDWKL